MGTHFKERLHAPDARLLGMFVKFPTLETTEILASAGYDFIIIDMEHAPLNVDTVYGMVVAAERCGMAALVRLRGHETATANMFMDAGASGVLVPHYSPYAVAQELITDIEKPPTGHHNTDKDGRATQWGIDGADEY